MGAILLLIYRFFGLLLEYGAAPEGIIITFLFIFKKTQSKIVFWTCLCIEDSVAYNGVYLSYVKSMYSTG